MYSLTIFKSPRWWEQQNRYVYDNKTHRRMDVDNWEQFIALFESLSKRQLKGKQDAELISPAVFKPNTTRKNDNVLAWAGWAALDVDDHEFEGDIHDVLRDKFGSYSYICYSTASSTILTPKFRLIFRLGQHIKAEQIKHFWYSLNSEFESLGDRQTKDLARMYYVPGTYDGANNFFYVNNGNSIDIDYIMAKWPYNDLKRSNNFIDRLPDAWKEQIIQYRKSRLDNTSFTWTDYKDCPFINKSLLKEYVNIAHIDGTGRYRMIYKLMISIAGMAVEKGYPITSLQIVDLIKQIDRDTANRYQSRPLDLEANYALEYVYKNGIIQ